VIVGQIIATLNPLVLGVNYFFFVEVFSLERFLLDGTQKQSCIFVFGQITILVAQIYAAFCFVNRFLILCRLNLFELILFTKFLSHFSFVVVKQAELKKVDFTGFVKVNLVK
jgi:hypothetical protein